MQQKGVEDSSRNSPEMIKKVLVSIAGKCNTSRHQWLVEAAESHLYPFLVKPLLGKKVKKLVNEKP